MDFWLVDVKSIINVNGNDATFDYINTYYTEVEAVKEAKLLSLDPNVLEVSVHHWRLNADGTQTHVVSGSKTDIPYSFINVNHREMKKAS